VDREIAANGIEGHVRGGQRHQANAGAGTLHVACDGIWWATYRAREKRCWCNGVWGKRKAEDSGKRDLSSVHIRVDVALDRDVGGGACGGSGFFQAGNLCLYWRRVASARGPAAA